MENMSFVTLLAVLVSVLMNAFVNGQDNQTCKCFLYFSIRPFIRSTILQSVRLIELPFSFPAIHLIPSINKPITRRQILDSSKLKEFADDNFKFDENERKLSEPVENTVGKE